MSSDFSLPPYTHTPGITPHPISDPAGHSYGRHEPSLSEFDEARWFECEPFVRGVTLFNHGYYWEAHEAWEAVWNAVGRSGAIADFIKGLIKWAAAGVKKREGNPDGTRRHLARAAELIARAHGDLGKPKQFAGQEIPQILQAITNASASISAPGCPDGTPQIFWPPALKASRNQTL